MIGSTNSRPNSKIYNYDLYANSIVEGLSNNTILINNYSLMGGGYIN